MIPEDEIALNEILRRNPTSEVLRTISRHHNREAYKNIWLGIDEFGHNRVIAKDRDAYQAIDLVIPVIETIERRK